MIKKFSKVVTKCQISKSKNLKSLIFLGFLPPVNTLRKIGSLLEEEISFPAELLYCDKSKLAQLGCIVCKQMGYPDTPCELHHIKDRRGMSKKSSDYEVIGLCYLHHRGDQGYHHSPKKFTERFGTQKELLQKVLTYVNCCGGCE